MPVILVGGIYLDVWLSPVSVRLAKNTEYSDLDTVRAEPGGSAFYVGKYLGESFNRRSYLFSRIGRGDPFSRHLERIVKDVPWIRGDHLTASGTSQCGVSVHLIDHDGTFLPTFTHRGSLVELSWPLILRDLQHYTRRGGGLLYISGLFRTGLAVDLVSSIQKLSPGVLVVLDHGRFQPDDHVAAVRSLLDAFRLAAIDIYICTYSEIAALARGAGVVVSGEVSQFELIESFAGMHFLPKITVVRGDPEPGQPVAILAIDDKIELIEDGPHNWVPRNIPGGNSAFTAGFLNHFYRESPQGNLQDYLENAVRAGLRFWATRG
jgi:hypothetical protein